MRIVEPATRALFRIQIEGIEHVPASGRAVLAANHVSSLDGVLLAVAVASRRRRMTRFLTAIEFFRKPMFGWALRAYRQIPIRRGAGDSGALDDAVETVRGGALAGIFPEGLVNPQPEGPLGRGRSGVARIALAAQSTVIPVGIWGTQRRWPRTGLRLVRPWRTRVALSFGRPVELQGDPGSYDDARAATDLVMGHIQTRVAAARALADEPRRPS